jgi:hypothetical protein
MRTIQAKRWTTVLAAWGALSAVAGAETLTGLAFLKTGVDASSALVGEAVVSHVADASACYWNPAGLASLESAQLMVSHIESFADLRHEYGAAVQPVGRMVVGLFFNGLWTDDIEGYDRQANPTGKFGYASYALGMAAGTRIGSALTSGLTVKYLNESIDAYSATGWAVDAGLQWDAGSAWSAFARPSGPTLHLGAAVTNVGGPVSFIDEKIDLPLAFQGGATTTLPVAAISGKVLLALEGRQVRDEDAALLMGVAYEFRELLRFGLGYQAGRDTRDLSLGVGIRQGGLAFHWAYQPIGEDLGDEHRFSLGLAL